MNSRAPACIGTLAAQGRRRHSDTRTIYFNKLGDAWPTSNIRNLSATQKAYFDNTKLSQ